VLALQAARLFDGDRLISPPAVLIEGDKIVAAGVSVPETVPVVDLGSQTLLPGLIDCHQHLCFDGNGSLEEQVSRLRSGVTKFSSTSVPHSLLAEEPVSEETELEGRDGALDRHLDDVDDEASTVEPLKALGQRLRPFEVVEGEHVLHPSLVS
jgi:cytosine/adenosine deaminase-related metal-dependent hydrolase